MQKSRQTTTLPAQRLEENYKTTPHMYARTMRGSYASVVTTGFAGKLLPVMATELLREDRLMESRLRFGLRMAETADMLLNPVRVKCDVWFVPKLAMERFMDVGAINRSYTGKQEVDASVIPWFSMVDPAGHADFLQTLGEHVPAGDEMNTDYVEAYNAIWNYIAAETSPSLSLRAWDEAGLAPAFWQHTALRHVKPSFDSALIHGEVELTTTSSLVNIFSDSYGSYPDTGTGPYGPSSTQVPPSVDGDRHWNAAALAQKIWGELEQGSVSVSLANLEMAKKTATFARARQEYQGLGDDQLIDLLMSGVRIPEEGMKHPLLIGSGSTIFGMSQRYATDAANLEKSVTNGETIIDVGCRFPQQNLSGILMATVQILPEQIYERVLNPYLVASGVEDLPDRLRDEFKTEPVEVVTNKMVDTDHSTPNDVFGYAPLNHRWQKATPKLGGLYYRPDASAPWDENRNRIWAVETVDPTLGDDFYLASNIHHQVFKDGATDPFEVTVNGTLNIEGLTRFGPGLRESVDDWEKISAKIDDTKIEQ